MAATKNSFKWTDEQIKILTERFQLVGPKKLSEEMGIPLGILYGQARRLKLGATRRLPPKGFSWDKSRDEMVRARFVEEGPEQLAAQFGISPNMVRKRAKSFGLYSNAGHRRWGLKRAENNSSCDIHYFDRWSPNMAYILGFLFADGSVDKNLYGVSAGVTIADREVIDFIHSELKSVNPLKITQAEGKNKAGVTVGLHSMVMVQQLLKLGLKPRKTYNDDPFPDVPDEFMPDFIRGELDGDGTVAIGKKYDGCSVGFVGSPKFIVGIRDALVRLAGVRPRRVRLSQGKTTVVASVGWGTPSDLDALFKFIYPHGHGFCLMRKKNKLQTWIESHTDRTESHWTVEDDEQIINLYHVLGSRKLGELLKRSVGAVKQRAKKLSIKTQRKTVTS